MQRNSAVKLNSQCKKDDFNRLNPEKNSKLFWKSCESYYSNKHLFGESKIALSENGECLTENNKIGKTFNSFFETKLMSVQDIKVQGIILISLNRPSILKSRKNFNLSKGFLPACFCVCW